VARAVPRTSPWSNGQTEGQITKLKLVKRQMYGRGKIDLLSRLASSAPRNPEPPNVSQMGYSAWRRSPAWLEVLRFGLMVNVV
jgi:hypothetical protein